MPINLNKLKASSNKDKTIGEKPAIPPTAPTPFIDKLSLVLTPPEHHQHDIYNGFFTVLDDPDQFVNAGSKSKWGEFKMAKRIVIPSVVDQKKFPLLQVAWAGKKITKMRLEFVPVDLGPDGMVELHAALTAVGHNGWNYWFLHGRITRIDVAVDLQGVEMNEFLCLPQQGMTTMQWKVDGQLETYIQGKKTGNQTAIYSRDKKRLAKKQNWTGAPVVRAERRLRHPPVKSLKDLPGMEQPFKGMDLVTTLNEPPAGEPKTYIWELFKHAATSQSLAVALSLLPPEKRQVYRTHIEAQVQPWWNPAAFWANWPKMLDELKISSATALS